MNGSFGFGAPGSIGRGEGIRRRRRRRVWMGAKREELRMYAYWDRVVRLSNGFRSTRLITFPGRYALH